jgi:hypothetical protein
LRLKAGSLLPCKPETNRSMRARRRQPEASPSPSLPGSFPSSLLSRSRAAAIDAGAKAFKANWLVEQSTSTRYHCISRFDSARPRSACTTTRAVLSAAYSARLTSPTLAPSPDCALCLVPETVPHYLLACPRFRRQCLALILRQGTARLSLRASRSAPLAPRLRATKSDPKPVLTFVRDTGRFPANALSGPLSSLSFPTYSYSYHRTFPVRLAKTYDHVDHIAYSAEPRRLFLPLSHILWPSWLYSQTVPGTGLGTRSETRNSWYCLWN